VSETICGCGVPTSGAWLCDDCGKTFSYAIVNVGVYFDDLSTVITRRVRYGVTGANKGSIGKEQPLPVDMRFINATPGARGQHYNGLPLAAGRATLARGAQLQWDAKATVVAWCRTIMEDQPEATGPACAACIHQSCTTIRRRRWPTDTMGSMVHYLARQFRWLIREQWAPDMLDEFLNLEHRLSNMVDRPPSRWYAGKCSATDESGNYCTAELYAQTDKGTIDCPACDTRHDVSVRRDILLREAKGYLVTATEAASALMSWTDYDGTEERLVDRIRKWRDREKLEVADVTSLYGRDRHLYRLGDIQDLLVKHAQRQQQQTLSA